MDRPVIVVDDRQVDWYPRCLEEAGFTVKVKRMETGDLWFTCKLGSVGIEDKPMSELMKDRRNGRLDDELRRLHETYPIPILLVRDNDYLDIADDNLLVGRQLHGILVAHAGWTPGEVGERVKRLYDYLDTASALEGKRREFNWLDPLDDRAEILYTVLGLCKGIKGRRELARKLAERYAVSDILGMSVADLRDIGFSKLMAEKFRDITRTL